MTMHICCRPCLHLPCTMLNCDLRKLARWDDASSRVSSKPTDDEFSPSIFFSILHLFIKCITCPHQVHANLNPATTLTSVTKYLKTSLDGQHMVIISQPNHHNSSMSTQHNQATHRLCRIIPHLHHNVKLHHNRSRHTPCIDLLPHGDRTCMMVSSICQTYVVWPACTLALIAGL